MKNILSKKAGLVLGLILLTLFVGVAYKAQAIHYIPGINPNPNPNPTPAPIVASTNITKNLHIGMKNDSQVKLLQTILIKLGYLKSTATGNFGTLTATAVKMFQKDNNLEQVGSVGPQTRSLVLKRAISATISAIGNMPVKAEVNTSIPIPKIIPKPNAACTSASNPSITVQSPNGGETFAQGQQVLIQWTTCNIPSQQNMTIAVYNPQTGDSYYLTGSPWTSGTINDGDEVLNISQGFYPPTQQFETVPPSNNYEISIYTDISSTIHPIDYSDAPFTLNGMCEYPAPPAGYHYTPGSNYNSETQCGMVLVKNSGV